MTVLSTRPAAVLADSARLPATPVRLGTASAAGRPHEAHAHPRVRLVAVLSPRPVEVRP